MFLLRKIKILVFVILLSSFVIPVAYADDKSGVIEVQIPKPKFEIFRAWQYGGFWSWDEKDPRFFKEFLKKIDESLFYGPF